MAEKAGTRAARVVGEFLVIVVGVLVALAVDEWRQSLSERQAEKEYLEQLHQDLEETSQVLAEAMTWATNSAAALARIRPYFSEGALPTTDTAAFVADLYNPSRLYSGALVSAAFVELQTLSRIDLIQDDELRREFVRHAPISELLESATGQLPTGYHDEARRAFPPAMQIAIRIACPIVRGEAQPCTDYEWDGDTRPLVALGGRPELIGDLNDLEAQFLTLYNLVGRSHESTIALRDLVAPRLRSDN